MIVLLRHAESENNDSCFNTYNVNATLTDKGLIQAKKLLDLLPYDFDLIIVSKYERTVSTVKLLLQRNIANVEVADIGEFAYLDTHVTNLDKKFRNQLKKTFWLEKDGGFRINEYSESYDDLIDRVIRFIALLKEKKEKTILVCSHKYFIQAIIWYLIHREDELLRNKELFYNYCLQHPLKPAEFFVLRGDRFEKYK